MRIDWRKHRSFVYGSWEPEVIEAISQTVSKGQVALDIGAQSGFYTLLLSKLVGPEGRVVAFEPLPPNYRILDQNIELNRASNVLVVKKALMDRAGQLSLTIPPRDSLLLAGELLNEKEHETLLVPAVSLDDYLAELRWPVHFIKMDVEGAEEAILRGAVRTIEMHHPAMLIEVHAFNQYGQQHPVVSLLQEMGYEINWLSEWTLTAHLLAKWAKKDESVLEAV